MSKIWIDDYQGPETPLVGGDVTEGVVRVGDTVRRPVGAHSPLVHALLDHLESVGFPGAPRFLGIDAAGREVLSFVEGQVAGRPRPGWIAEPARLRSVGRLVRSYDDAAIDFVPPDEVDAGFASVGSGSNESASNGMPELPPAPPYEPELIGHLDFTPENIVFREGEAFALIDFDLAKPATRVDEVFNAMLYWAPLGDPRDSDPLLREVDVPGRCRMLADAYGMSERDRGRLVEVAVMRSERSWHLMKRRAEINGGGWLRMWNEGVGDVIRRRQAWLERHGATIEAALTAA